MSDPINLSDISDLDIPAWIDVDSICLECVKHNHIHSFDLKPGDRLAC